MNIIRTVLMVIALVIPVTAGDANVPKEYGLIDIKDLIVNPVEYDGKLVEVTADVVAVNADRQSMDVFDTRSKALILVSLKQLSNSQRRELIKNPVHRVSVFGKLEIKMGKAEIVADKVLPLSTTLIAGR